MKLACPGGSKRLWGLKDFPYDRTVWGLLNMTASMEVVTENYKNPNLDTLSQSDYKESKSVAFVRLPKQLDVGKGGFIEFDNISEDPDVHHSQMIYSRYRNYPLIRTTWGVPGFQLAKGCFRLVRDLPELQTTTSDSSAQRK